MNLPWDALKKRVGVCNAIGLAMSAMDNNLKDTVTGDAESLSLLPDPEKGLTLTWSEVKRKVPRVETKAEPISGSAVSELLQVRDKQQFQELSEQLWPARTKTDLALRRTRLLDWFIVMRDQKREVELEEVLLTTKNGWDIIFVQNLIIATNVFGITWFRRWSWLGAFDGDLAHFISVAKKVHDLIKSFGVYEKDWVNYVECTTMGGYRNPPFPGFDVVEEAKKLAEGGDRHDYFGGSWDALVKRYLPMNYRYVEYIPFKEWVAKAEWLTAGASSVGYVELTLPDGKKKKVKARKNMVADVIDLGDLADMSLQNVEQVNYAIIKSELGKLRIAVAGDIFTYLKMTWVNSLLGGAYKDWPGNTTEEDFLTQTKRLARMLELCSRKFGLPYDYAGFDHQPTTQEIKGIVTHLCSHARLNVPLSGLGEFDTIVSEILIGFDNARLDVRGENEASFRVTGGLMSGLRWTSVVGNGWNTVITGLVTSLLAVWGIDTDKIERYIRGDDSAIYVDNWATGVLMNEGYKMVGAKAGEGKFALRKGEMEFLRVWFDDRCRGYGARSIPGLSQRKPWSSNPWSEDMVLKALYDTCVTLKRRVAERRDVIDSTWRTLRRIWCRNHSMPIAVSWTPVFSGGFGIEPGPIGRTYKIVPPVPRVDMASLVKVENQLPWRANVIAAYAKERYDLDVSDLASDLAHRELLNTIASDNIPDVARSVRSQWLAEARAGRYRVEEETHVVKVLERPVAANYYTPQTVDVLLDVLRHKAPLFGKHPELSNARVDYARFRVKGGFLEWLKRYYPAAYGSTRLFHRSWHMSEIIDYLSGKIYVRSNRLHPALIKVFSWTVAAACLPRKKVDRLSTLWTGALFDEYVYSSSLSQLIYNW